MVARIYLAGRYDHRERFLEYANDLEKLGFQVKSRWLAGDDASLLAGGYKPMQHPFTDHIGIRPQNIETAGYLGQICIDDIENCDAIIFFAEPLHVPARKGGRMVELGIVIGWNLAMLHLLADLQFRHKFNLKFIIVVGPPENAFTCMDFIERVDTFDEALDLLRKTYGVAA